MARSVLTPVIYAWTIRDLLTYKLLSEQQPRNNVRTCQQCVEDSGRVLTGWPHIEASLPGGHAGTIGRQKTRPSTTPAVHAARPASQDAVARAGPLPKGGDAEAENVSLGSTL